MITEAISQEDSLEKEQRDKLLRATLAITKEEILYKIHNHERDLLLHYGEMLISGWTLAKELAKRRGSSGNTRWTREELLAYFLPLRDPEVAAIGFFAASEHQKAIAEHQQLLACPWSPLPTLATIFAEVPEWEELDLSASAIAEAHLAVVESMIEKIATRTVKVIWKSREAADPERGPEPGN